jgi:hypothetical protein
VDLIDINVQLMAAQSFLSKRFPSTDFSARAHCAPTLALYVSLGYLAFFLVLRLIFFGAIGAATTVGIFAAIDIFGFGDEVCGTLSLKSVSVSKSHLPARSNIIVN